MHAAQLSATARRPQRHPQFQPVDIIHHAVNLRIIAYKWRTSCIKSVLMRLSAKKFGR
jgi:hypothetical protein